MNSDKNEQLSDQALESGEDALNRAIALGRSLRKRRGKDTLPASEAMLDMLRGERDAQIDLLGG